jgi:DNA-binding SARP family transcriptional activator
LPDRFAPRPRLERLILRLISRRRLVVVTAAAGSGKTTAVLSAIRKSKRPVAWLTVDRPDQAPGRLLTYLEAALACAIPTASRVATGALAAGIPHAEAAGLLAQAMGESPEPLVVVVDELERLDRAPEAWAVVEALLRYAPAGTSFVLLSRRDLPTELCTIPSPAATAVLSDADLAFTPEEAERALARSGRKGADGEAIVRSTAGWVTGVMFESWRADTHLLGQGGETDPLYDYLSSQMLGQLSEAQREFLITTSLWDEVTAARALAVGIEDPEATMAALRSLHLPVVWGDGGNVLRCHTYFREYLLARLERRDEATLIRLRLAHGRRLAEEGHDEEATEQLLAVGAVTEALDTAERAIVGVVERLDLGIAERWMRALHPNAVAEPASPFTTAELLLAIARDEIGVGVRLIDRLIAGREQDPVALTSERTALLMVWCYFHLGRQAAIDEVLARVSPGPAAAAMRYAWDALFGDGSRGTPVAPSPLPTGPIGAIVCNAHYALGRLAEIADGPREGWVQAVERPWRTAALRARGQTKLALDLFEEALSRGVATATMLVFAGPEVLMDAGRPDEASQLIAQAREVTAATGSTAYRGFCSVLQAKLELRFARDPAAAISALGEPDCVEASAAFRFIGEVADTWRGLALLRLGRDVDASIILRRAVEGMVAGDRMLELPTAAVYLAESLGRTGDDSGADRAAALALDAATRQGSNHLLLQALADCPGVAARRLGFPDERWRQLSRDLMLQGAHSPTAPNPPVKLVEFGRRSITISGEEVRPRIAKSYELLAYLTAQPDGTADRDTLLDALFDARRNDSARAYLRQAIHRLREVLPDGLVAVENGHVKLADRAGVISESVSLEQRLAEAARLQGTDRLLATRAALAVCDRGDYLPGSRGEWAEERQRHLAELVSEARYQAAVLAYGAGEYALGRELLAEVLHDDPFRESAWRLEMRIAEALGDEDGVLRAYRGCEQALAEVGASPADSTRQLLRRLRP